MANIASEVWNAVEETKLKTEEQSSRESMVFRDPIATTIITTRVGTSVLAYGTATEAELDYSKTPDLKSQVEELTKGFLDAMNHVEALSNRVIELEKKQSSSSAFREITNAEAKKEITDFIVRKKSEGINEIGMIDIVKSLELPMDQVAPIVYKLVESGKLSKI